ncbi:MAG: 50S ribosomal protein L4 [Firmicutes bacterium]|jgi:large subunit ribosomal protein L4|nr:50S ribosomal protein L4 [Bacillota bacterium]
MPTVEVYNVQGEQVGELELSPEIFEAEVNEKLLFDVVQMLLAARRRGTASTKTRAEVRGGGRKPWRQKGTGRARHGSIRSPIWTGGGIAFGPSPRKYRYLLPKKMRRAALRSALTSRLAGKGITVLNELKLAAPKTKEIVQILNNLGLGGSVLLVTGEADSNIYKSARNIPGVDTAVAGMLNVLDILNHDTLLLTKDAVARIEEVFSDEKSA